MNCKINCNNGVRKSYKRFTSEKLNIGPNMQFNRNLGSNVAKSIFIAILMISMSLSMGFMGDNNPPWSTESSLLSQITDQRQSAFYLIPRTTLDLDLIVPPVIPIDFDIVQFCSMAGFIYSDVVVELNKIHLFYHKDAIN